MKKIILTLFVFLAVTSNSFAQSQPGDTEVQALIDFINDGVNSLVNANTLFTSQDEVASGYFKFDTDDGSDRTKYRVLKIPVVYSLCDDKNSAVRPYVRGRIGHASLTESILPTEGATGDNDFSGVYTWSFALGGGADIELFDNLILTPDFGATYSRIKNKYDYNNDISQIIGYYLDGQVFNWNLDVMTYTPSIRLRYSIPLESFTTTFQSGFSHLINKSFKSSSDIIDIDSSTNIVRNSVQVEVPTGLSLANSAISLRPFFARNDIGGAAKEGLGFDFFYEVGADVAFKVKDQVPLFSELSVGGSYSWGDNMEGTRFGISGAF